jgi:cyclophilin family peptidyl-prolyl cis-trans isomerase
VDNFLDHYVSRGFYNGTMFHYVEKGFMIIGGGYTPDGEPKETRTPVHNEAHNGLKNLRGTVAMARHAKYVDSATSQFFINLADNPTLDHVATGGDDGYGYCVFGQVIEGMEVVDRIANVAVKDSETFPKKPVDPVTVESAARLK